MTYVQPSLSHVDVLREVGLSGTACTITTACTARCLLVQVNDYELAALVMAPEAKSSGGPLACSLLNEFACYGLALCFRLCISPKKVHAWIKLVDEPQPS
jgi:hypothetical protein